MSFAEWLWRRLRERHISERQLAAKAGLHHSAVSRIVTGRSVPSLTTVQAICSALRTGYTIVP